MFQLEQNKWIKMWLTVVLQWFSIFGIKKHQIAHMYKYIWKYFKGGGNQYNAVEMDIYTLRLAFYNF